MGTDRIILPITPQTWFKVLPQHGVFFRIPEVCRALKGGKPCVHYRRNSLKGVFKEFGNKQALCPHTISKEGLRLKRRIERYNKYKVDVLSLAKAAEFELPKWGWALYFYFPLPKRCKDKYRKLMHGQPKISKPDIDNAMKAFMDSLSITDETVAQLSGAGKFWVDTLTVNEKGEPQYGAGWIEILTNQPVYNPFGVELIDQDYLKVQPKRKWIRKTQAPKRRNPKPLKLLDQSKLFSRPDNLS